MGVPTDIFLGDIDMRGFSMLAAGSLLTIALATSGRSATPSLEWSKSYDGGGSYLDVATAALCDADGNLVVAGESADGIDGTDMVIRKLERAGGDTLWTKRYPAFDGNDMALTDMIWDPSGDLLVAGYVRGCEG
jgi:hypothetical protein